MTPRIEALRARLERETEAVRLRLEEKLSLREIAERVGLSVSQINFIVRDVGKPLKRGRPPGPPSLRNQAIAAIVAEGSTLQAVADEYGITRERVRQIVKAAGARSTRSRVDTAARRAQAEALLKQGLSEAEVHKRVGGPLSTITHVRVALGIPKGPLVIEQHLPLVELVRQGRSVMSVEAEYGIPRGRLTRLCRREGVEHKHGRWRDFSKRRALIEQGRALGVDWAVIAERVSAAEGLNVGWATVASWAKRYLPHLVAEQRRRDFSKRRAIVEEGRAQGLTWEALAERVGAAEGSEVGGSALYNWATRHLPHLTAKRPSRRRSTTPSSATIQPEA